MQNRSLAGKRIWITGASSGIGRACALHANERGAEVVLIGRDEARLEMTQSMLHKPEQARCVSLDLTDFEKVTSMVTELVSSLGKVDGIVNAAGISTTLPFRNISPAKLDEFFKVNVQSSLMLTKELTKQSHFSMEGGSVIFLTSVMAHTGEAGKVLYSMSKGALLAAARSLAIEFASRKIRVNCISPGVVETPMSQSAYYSQDESARARITALHPLGMGTPEDVAASSSFLLSDDARWITGTQLIIDGGYTAR